MLELIFFSDGGVVPIFFISYDEPKIIKRGGEEMELNAPKKSIFVICVVAFIVGLIGTFATIPLISGIAFWLIAGSFVLLALANILKGL